MAMTNAKRMFDKYKPFTTQDPLSWNMQKECLQDGIQTCLCEKCIHSGGEGGKTGKTSPHDKCNPTFCRLLPTPWQPSTFNNLVLATYFASNYDVISRTNKYKRTIFCKKRSTTPLFEHEHSCYIPLVSPSIEDNFLSPTRVTRMTRVTQIGYKSDTNDASDTNLWQMQPSSCRLSTNITREETAHPQTERLFCVQVFVLFCVCSKNTFLTLVVRW